MTEKKKTPPKKSKVISNVIQTELRENFGKGYARRLRVAGRIPAVLYGHGTDPIHVSLPGHEISLLLRRANAILDLQIDGKSQIALVKDVQKDPVRQIIEHIDLVVIRKGEKVEVDVSVHVVGEPASGAVIEQEAHTLLVEADAINIPTSLEVSVEGVEVNTHILAKQLTLPAGTTLIADPETLVVSVVAPNVEEDEAPAAAAAE